MRPFDIFAFIIGVIFMLALLFLIVLDTPIADALGIRKEPETTESPSWWHIIDENDPREDMIHYVTYDEVMPSEAP